MANRPFTRGVHDLGDGLYGYVQPDGSWGWSNAGLIVSDGQTLLIDTLMSVPLTREMLDAFARLPGGGRIDRLVNTHANPDHFFGNGLVADAEIIATAEARREMAAFDPRMLAGLAANYTHMGDAGEFLYETMGRVFDFAGVDAVTLPTRTFDRSLSLTVGDKTVELMDLGPAHTASDTIAWVPADRVVFTGDLLFNEGHPVMWAGPVENWIAACRHILSLNPTTVVPGHGPIADASAVANLLTYFEHVRDEARRRFDVGMSWKEAARDIDMSDYRGWSDPERIVANVFSLYRQWGADLAAGPIDLFAEMGRYRRERTAPHGDHDHAH